MSKDEKKTGSTDVNFTRPKDGETAKEIADRMAPGVIAAMNAERAKKGLGPMPKSKTKS